MKIVSGGQTGVDRAALDAALAKGVAAGGWCPAGRLAEDGTIPPVYPLEELPGGGYRARTRQNVVDSDGTLVIAFGKPTGGTLLTVELCAANHKPCCVVDADAGEPEIQVARVNAFIRDQKITVLNVAGPRASGEPRAYPYARRLIELLLTVQP